MMFGRDLLLVVAEAVRATMEGRTSVVSWRATALVPSCIFRSCPLSKPSLHHFVYSHS